MKIKVAPSILAADFTKLGSEIRAVETAGADLIHVDVMDGKFVPNITVGPPVVKALRAVARVPLDVHLMITEPEHIVDAFVSAGAACLTVHTEATNHLDRIVRHVKAKGCKIGVALNPATPLNSIYYVLPLLDIVLIMTVNPGFGGQTFLEYTMAKVEALRLEIDRRRAATVIAVDGGIKPENASVVAKAGANILVAGTSIFRASDYGRAIELLRSRAEAAISPP